MTRKILPIGIQTFREIRDGHHYYVDKTDFARRLLGEGKYYVLSRPRRFGKSLFLDMLGELFEGNVPLFRGLHIHDHWDWTTRYPVIRLSFGGGVIRSPDELEGKIHDLLDENARRLGIRADGSGLCLRPGARGLDRERIRLWCNGYNWTGEAVYNPFDVLLLLKERQFRPWWFETETPTFLVDLLTERETWLPKLDHMETDATLLSAFEVDHIATVALLFQSGYLKIEREEEISGTYFYQLRYPNREVYQSLNGALLTAWTPPDQTEVQHRKSLHRLLLANDFAGLQQLFSAFFASIPTDWYRNNPIARYEGYYASVFYPYFAALGLDLTPEESSHAGRLDLALRFNGQIYLFEFKVVELEHEGRALPQLNDRGYADKYRADGRPIHLIGVEFSRERRRVVGLAVETLSCELSR